MSLGNANGLTTLADHFGIGRTYVDAWGVTQQVSDKTLRALLEALSFPASSDGEAAQSLAAFEARAWSRPLEPVVVVEQGTEIDVPLVVADTHEDDRVEWRVRMEEGAVREGLARVRDLTILTRRSGASRRRLPIPADGLSPGYHTLEVQIRTGTGSSALIVAPPRAYTPDGWATGNRREWAITAQLYALRSNRNWGIGDCTDLADLAREAAARGAAAIGLNPLHALFPANPTQVSPYSPSSRTFLNPVYIDVTAVPEFVACDEARALIEASAFRRRLAQAKDAELVDYAAVWAMKRKVLAQLHRFFRAHHIGPNGTAATARGDAYHRFLTAGGDALERFATFEALQEHFQAEGAGPDWRRWPAAFRDPASPAVAAFAAEYSERIAFVRYLQWEADRQLGAAAKAMGEAGMSTGLYLDIAVGVDPNGAEAWGDQALLVAEASVGAPPDIHNPKGQDWGLTPLDPLALKERAYGPFIAALRANMRHAGAVRIDHVVGLQRLWWVPRTLGPAAGAYVSYPFNDLVRILALESHRNRCFVVGEDLGTVPEGFRADLQRSAILSYRLLMFERENGDGDFLPPSAYPELAAAAVSTHDLPTLSGFWQGRDLEWRRTLHLYPDTRGAAEAARFRADAKERLLRALQAHGALPDDAAVRLRRPARGAPDDARALAAAAHRFLAQAPARFLLAQLEDLLGEIEQMNLPGTVNEHPNWRRKLRLPVDLIFKDDFVQHLVALIGATRRAPVAAPIELALEGDGR